MLLIVASVSKGKVQVLVDTLGDSTAGRLFFILVITIRGCFFLNLGFFLSASGGLGLQQLDFHSI
jgi:hypothetical protein